MGILLDTHIALWWISDSPKLTTEDRRLIADPANTIYVSAASAWEVEIKRGLGKIVIADDWKDVIDRNGFTWLDVKPWHTDLLRQLPDIHKDPFDRMIVAQAKGENLRLISHDSKVNDYLK